MHSLPWEYWDEYMLKDTGNTLGTFVCSPDQTNLNKITSYVQIYFYMHIAKSLSDAINNIHEDSE